MVLLSVLLVTTFLSLTGARQVTLSGRCGDAADGNTCIGSSFGICCSAKGYCGNTAEYCGDGCQRDFGSCRSANTIVKPVSTDGRCGDDYGSQTCSGLESRSCCSVYGYCGNSDEYCRPGRCQPDYGICYPFSSSVSPAPTSSQAPAAAILNIPDTVSYTSTVTVVQPAVTKSVTITAPPIIQPAVTVTTTAPPIIQPAVTVTTTAPPIIQPAVTVTTTAPPLIRPAVTVTLTTTTIQLTTIRQTITAAAAAAISPTLPYPNQGGGNVGVGTAIQSANTYTCSDAPRPGGGFRLPTLGSWINLAAGLTLGTQSLPSTPSSKDTSYKFRIDSTSPNTPQRLVQTVSLCPGGRYALGFKARRATPGVCLVGMTGSVQVGKGPVVRMAGGIFGMSTRLMPAARTATVVVPSSSALVPAMVMIEANFMCVGLTGTKEIMLSDVVLERIS